jgi:hypothetical protein
VADNAVFGAPPDLSRNLDFLMNLLPTLARAGNSANPQDIFEEFVNDPASSGFREFADQAGLPDVLGLAMELLGPDVLGPAGDVAKFASVPGFFRLLQRNPELSGEITEQGARLSREGAEIWLQRLADGTVEVPFLRRGDRPGTGSELKQIVRDAARQENVDMRAVNAPFGPGNFTENSARNAERFRREGYEQLPDGTWILRANRVVGGGGR